MEHAKAEILRRRIALNQGYLRAGVAGALAIRYLRQIAEDEEALGKLPGSPCSLAADGLAVSPYLSRPARPLFAACREIGRDGGGANCPTCSIKTICDAGRLQQHQGRRFYVRPRELNRAYFTGNACPSIA